jgi:DNA polymerase-3 subunit alpha
MANIPSYCARKLGQEKVEYLHPRLKQYLEPTYGIITYQEQVQQIARELAGYSLAEADILRRAMGKKIKAEMDAQRGRFLSGATERGVDKATAEEIFDACAKFAEYGFNKSHSAPYAFITYQTAYMKANYPVEFLAASMTLSMQNTDKLAEFRAEANRLGIKVGPPSINHSGATFEVENGTIRYALAALKGVGAQAVETIVEARGDKPFRDLADFAGRINPRAVNKRVLESLASSGAFDALEPDRARAHAAVDAILGHAQHRFEATTVGQSELFGGGAVREQLPIPAVAPWLPAELLQKEYDAIGFFLSGHPLDDYAQALKTLRVSSYAEFAKQVRAGATAGRVAATVLSRAERRTKTGNRMGIIGLSDPSGHYEAVIFAEGLAQYRDALEPGKAVVLFLTAEAQGDEVRARIQTAEPLDRAAEKIQKGLRVFVRTPAPIESVKLRLQQARNGNGRNGSSSRGPSAPSASGEGEVCMVLLLPEAEVEVRLPGRFNVSPQIAGAIKAVPGVVTVEAV